MHATIFNIQKFSIHDGPGIRTVVFFKGCHLRCKWCCNPESQDINISLSFDKEKCTRCNACISACKYGALSFQGDKIVYDFAKCTHCGSCVSSCIYNAIAFYGKKYSVDEVLDEVLKDKAFYIKSGGGVTLSGGEVFLQPDFAKELCDKLHEENITIAIETSLAVAPHIFEKLSDKIDIWQIDLKHYDSKKHFEGTNIGNDYTINNIRSLVKNNANITLRIAVIRDFNDKITDAQEFVSLIKDLGVKNVELLPFHQFGESKYKLLDMDYSLKGVKPVRNDELNGFVKVFKDAGLNIQIGG